MTAPVVSTTLLDQVRKTAEARRLRDTLHEQIAAKRAEFETALAEEMSALKDALCVVTIEEDSLRALALVAFAENPTNKKPAPGIQVTETKGVEYDTAQALQWAKETKLALVPESLDVKAFAKIAGATPLPFVRYTITPSVKLATDLPAALAAEGL